jgi:hypothetical protein
VLALTAIGWPSVGTSHWRNETLKESERQMQENNC